MTEKSGIIDFLNSSDDGDGIDRSPTQNAAAAARTENTTFDENILAAADRILSDDPLGFDGDGFQELFPDILFPSDIDTMNSPSQVISVNCLGRGI